MGRQAQVSPVLDAFAQVLVYSMSPFHRCISDLEEENCSFLSLAPSKHPPFQDSHLSRAFDESCWRGLYRDVHAHVVVLILVLSISCGS